MDERSRYLIHASALASRFEYHEELRKLVAEVKGSGVVPRTELYECFLQIYLFAGFPAGLESVRALGKVWPEHEVGANAAATRETMSYPMFLERGQKLYQEIYSRNAEMVRSEMLKLSPELAAWAVIEGYGKTLSRSGLDVPTRELAIVAVLTQLAWERQLFSHIMGALNVGARKEDVREAIEIGALGNDAKRTRGLTLLERVK
jgi:4-carboxymuconolactone decarboxylase